MRVVVQSKAVLSNVNHREEDLLSGIDQIGFEPTMKAIYQEMGLNYPKFFKMDRLCKVAFLACEKLLSQLPADFKISGDQTALVLSTRSGCWHTDQKHFDKIKDASNYFPSPGVFVYTLPNIMLGEICIRHQIKGENTCLMTDGPDGHLLYDYVEDLLLNEGYNICITGWVNVMEDKVDARLFLITKQVMEKDLPSFDRNFMTIDQKDNG